jgi:hypothetical protein
MAAFQGRLRTVFNLATIQTKVNGSGFLDDRRTPPVTGTLRASRNPSPATWTPTPTATERKFAQEISRFEKLLDNILWIG